MDTIIKLAGAALALLLATFGVVAKFAKIESKVENHKTRLDKHDKSLSAMDEKIDDTMTFAKHTGICKDNMTTVCRKIDGLSEQQKATDKKVDENRALVTEKLTEIAGFMGEIRGRNKEIDKDRASRRKTEL